MPHTILTELREVQRMELTDVPLLRRLEALRARHRLNPPESSGTTPGEVEVIRIVCSDGLV